MSTEARAWPNKKAALPAQGLKSKPQQHDNKEQQQEARTRTTRTLSSICAHLNRLPEVYVREPRESSQLLADAALDRQRQTGRSWSPTMSKFGTRLMELLVGELQADQDTLGQFLTGGREPVYITGSRLVQTMRRVHTARVKKWQTFKKPTVSEDDATKYQ